MIVDLQNITVAWKFDFRRRKRSPGKLIFIEFHRCILESPSHPYGRNRIEKSMQIAETVQTTTRQLGNSDMQITAIGFGAWAIGGGDWQFGWGSQDDNDSVAAIQRALDLGINWIDTAAVYGSAILKKWWPRSGRTAAEAASSSPNARWSGARNSGRRRIRFIAASSEIHPQGTRIEPAPPEDGRQSISTRSIGPIPRMKSRRAGRRWRN